MEKAMSYLSDIIDKGKEIIIRFLSAVPGETLITMILAAIVVIYFMKASKDKVKRTVQSKKNKTKQRLYMEHLELELQMFFEMMSGGNKPAFLKACQSYMEKNNYKLSKKATRQMIFDHMWVKDNNQKQKTKYLEGDKADKLIDAVYKFMQLGFEEGPEYEKLQKKINAKLKHSMKDVDIDVNTAEFDKIKDSIAKDRTFESDMHSQQVMDDMNRHMQEHMMHDMNMQMQQQMMNDMQIQMMNDMQMQMQMQMMQDMQMQMQQQMMNDMQMQMQNQMMNDMNQQMLNSMNDANMAMTSTDFGGHMNSDMNSGNFGMF